MENERSMFYEAPEVFVMEVEVEQGFAGSIPVGGEGGHWVECNTCGYEDI